MDIQGMINEWNTPVSFVAAVLAIIGVLWGVFKLIHVQYRKYKEPSDVRGFLVNLKLRKKYKIAIVDDEINDFPIEYLNSLGYGVSTYESISLNDVDRLLSFDIIFLDVRGVVKEDFETGGAKLLKLVKKSKPSIMVIAVSSGKYQLNLNSFFENSDDVLNKPIQEKEIEDSISELIKSNIDVDSMADELSNMIVCSKSRQEKFINKSLISYFSGEIGHDYLCDVIHQNTNHRYSEKISSLAERIMGRLNYDS